MSYRISRFILHLLMCYISIIIMLGYDYGDSDMVESLSLLLHLHNPEVLTNDFYVSSLSASALNERMPFIYFLSIGYNFLTTWVAILHALSSMILIAGMYKISSLYLASRFFRWITIYITIVLLSNYNLGGNELYTNYLAPSLPSHALASWAIYYILTERFTRGSLFLLLAAVFQPIVAVQILLLGTFMVAISYLKKQTYLKKSDGLALIFVILMIAYFIALWRYHHSLSMDAAEYLNILRLRMSHHFFPSHFPVTSYLLYLGLAGFSLYWFYQNGIKVFYWIAITVFGCIVYTGLWLLGFDLGMSTQWFKTTIWLEFFGIIAIFGFINERVMMRLNMAYFFALLLCTLAIFQIFRWPPLTDKKYNFGDRWLNDPEVVIAQAAKEISNEKALFIIPPDFDSFRHVAGRSIFVDFKSIAHNKTYFKEWLKRVQEVYKIKVGKNEPAGFDAMTIGMENYFSLQKTEIDGLASKYNITHMLTETEHFLPYPVEARTEKYVIYAIADLTNK